jgi:hypothetical protein
MIKLSFDSSPDPRKAWYLAVKAEVDVGARGRMFKLLAATAG